MCQQGLRHVKPHKEDILCCIADVPRSCDLLPAPQCSLTAPRLICIQCWSPAFLQDAGAGRSLRQAPQQPGEGKAAGEQPEAQAPVAAGRATITGDYLVDSLTAASLDLPPQAVRVSPVMLRSGIHTGDKCSCVRARCCASKAGLRTR